MAKIVRDIMKERALHEATTDTGDIDNHRVTYIGDGVDVFVAGGGG